MGLLGDSPDHTEEFIPLVCYSNKFLARISGEVVPKNRVRLRRICLKERREEYVTFR